MAQSPHDQNPYQLPQPDHDANPPDQDPMAGDFDYAGFGPRFFAFLIDGILAYLLSGIPAILLFFVFIIWNDGNNLKTFESWFGMEGVYVLFLIMMVSPFLAFASFFAIQESSSRQATIGKKMFRIKVSDIHGNRIGFFRAMGRHFAHYLSLISLVGFIIQPYTRHKQTLHDLLAKTLVLNDSPIT